MTTVNLPMRATARQPGKGLRYWAVGFTVLAVTALVFMMSGIRPEGALLDISEATSSLLPPIALIINLISVVRNHRTTIDIASLVVSGLVVGAMLIDAIIYTLSA